MIDYDKYGHCSLCHTNLIIEEVIDGKVQLRFTVDKDETEYLLDDGSRMRVCICKPCKAKLTDKDSPKIMASVIKGWEMEVAQLDWAKEKKEQYLNEYSKKKIVFKTEGQSKDLIETKRKEALEGKVK